MVQKCDLGRIKSYLVGGAVRDQLLNRPVVEKDYVVVGSSTEQMLELGFTQVGKDFPVFLHPITKDEYALARTEKKQGNGYTGFVCHSSPDVTLEQDLSRRDLTVNAMVKTANGDIIDPYNGQNDLKNKLLRHVSPAFIEDPLRVLRVARFAARYYYLGFSIASETMLLMKDISQSNELSALSAERVFKEMERSLIDKNPEIFFLTLYQCEALKTILPELHNVMTKQSVIDGNAALTPLINAAAMSGKLTVRFAALCLTIYQQAPTTDQLTTINNICHQLKVPSQLKSITLKACEHLNTINNVETQTASAILVMFNKIDVWRKPEDFDDILLACQAITQNNVAKAHQSNRLTSMLIDVKKITAQDFIKQGMKGKDIKIALDHARQNKIEDLLNS